jgi:hypothetical protein
LPSAESSKVALGEVKEPPGVGFRRQADPGDGLLVGS